jgi:cytoskeleton protein RodZ
MEPINETGLGLFLKREREKKGLTLDHMAKVTRLRLYYLEALENEDWSRLPDQVFIKGFLKTYTRALGLNYEQVIKQFASSVPDHNSVPKPLMSPGKTNNVYIALIIFIVLIVSLFVVFLIKGSAPHLTKAEAPSTNAQVDKTVQIAPQDDHVKPAQTVSQAAVNNARPPEKEVASSSVTESAPVKENTPSPDKVATGQDSGTEKQVQVAIPEQTAKAVQTPVQKAVVTSVEEPANNGKWQYVLTCYVISETYVKIWIDNNPPIQHIFPKGSRHQWTGNAGFYVLVGNAGGIEFDFNGKKFKDLGRKGEVVKLRLPENFNLNVREN